MNLRQIEVFHAVYLAGSVSGAARSLNVSQPSVSKLLRHTETRLGLPLFRRIKGRLQPTEEAHALFREVDEVFDRVRSLQQLAKNLRIGGAGNIRVGILPSIGLEIIPQAVGHFRDRYPRVGFELRILSPSDMLKALHERKIDLAVCFNAPSHPRLSVRELAHGEIGLLYREDDMPGAPERLDLSIVEGINLIGIAGGGPVSALYASALESRGISVETDVFVQAGYVAAALVRRRMGFAAVDEYTARASTDSELRFRPFDPPILFKVQYLFLDECPPTSLLQSFIEILVDVLNSDAVKPRSIAV